jgi:hypothetical protein
VFLAFGEPFRMIEFKYTYPEIRLAVSSFFKKEQMKVLQNYETFATIVSKALGGDGNHKKTPDNVINVQSSDQLALAIRSQLNGGYNRK